MKYNSCPNISFTVTNDICTGCGTCKTICPREAISINLDNGLFLPKIDVQKCLNKKGCHKCLDVCPGIGVNLMDIAKKLLKDEMIQEDICIGRFVGCYSGYSTNKGLRYHCASGGMISQFLIWLLENKIIDGAIVTRFDQDSPFKVKSSIATCKEEILSAKSSKYGPVSLGDAIKDLKHAEGTKYVVVGLPCHIEGVRKLISIDRTLREKVVGLFSLYCSSTRSFNFTEYLFKTRAIELDEITYLAYRDNGCLGGLVAKGGDFNYYEDYQSYCHPLRSFFIPKRCSLCADHYGELADISFGDIHIKPYSEDKIGVNSVVVRNRYWLSKLKEAADAGSIVLNNLELSVLRSAQKMAQVKKTRNIKFGMVKAAMGQVAPNFGSLYGNKISILDCIRYFFVRIQQYIGSHKELWWLIPYFKSKVNIH